MNLSNIQWVELISLFYNLELDWSVIRGIHKIVFDIHLYNIISIVCLDIFVVLVNIINNLIDKLGWCNYSIVNTLYITTSQGFGSI